MPELRLSNAHNDKYMPESLEVVALVTISFSSGCSILGAGKHPILKFFLKWYIYYIIHRIFSLYEPVYK